ncbi:RIP metalloprotease RseP [Wohlfahrtiimonas chitiniclastica]|uniref:RIP metalloprotease RseP n=1 Tax=Wohlfahrtiimonas chitiniclastica TaxID=400946 RepID=UPI001BCA8615|nr:RIP metalloprotease RseP [Wohlfahrtiimonas chitiniclastica]MBS7816372.1 RIP metalloprotease RseP [Wohlfahrtiimonas chitiniclastica]MBS7821633.1 RIP metalloprotease RseP [Wohlfahrtiimonas chitiniclastica]MBS7829425.1 RIP metalloprotease RseP [Wohlfahrtiimonas chitiniclastica]MBS7831392.1 RIP metalloprotease RseP [Wohlfahrtiimonas chitiniclastica]
MFEWLETFFRSVGGFIILMGLLVTIHEFGHFYVARKLGFAVSKFSIGFGKNIWSRKGKDGIEYAVGLIPLGGYVAFVDDDGHTESFSEGMKFKEAPIWKRACVVAAGPLANIVLAIALLWGLFMYGVPAYKPYVEVTAEQPFASAGLQNGDLIRTIDGENVESFTDMMQKLIEYLDDGRAEIIYERNGKERYATLDIGESLKLDAKTDLYKELGVNLYLPALKPIVSEVVAGSAAATAGLMKGDDIIEIAGHPTPEWHDVLTVAADLKDGQAVEVIIDRGGKTERKTLMPQADADGRVRLGVMIDASIYKDLVTKDRLGPIDALSAAVHKTVSDGLMVFKFLGRMITGDFHINTMAGPVSIANIAGQALASGLVYFVQLAALFSINIGLLNLLPIPVLDGGRLVGLGIEKIMGKHQFPDSIKVKVLQLGALVMFIFMAVVISYDVAKWF